MDVHLKQPAAPQAAAGVLVATDQLYRRADLTALPFVTTEDLQPLEGFMGQARALDAIRLSAGVDKPGFNLFAIGRLEAGMREAVRAMLKDAAQERPTPNDWVYVNNFDDVRRPIAISLPAGGAPVFRGAMDGLIDELKAALPTAFDSEDYHSKRAAIDESFQKEQMKAFEALGRKAEEKAIALLRTEVGFTLLPAAEGKVVPPDEFNKWPEARRKQVQADIEVLETDLEHIVHQIPQREKSRRDAVRMLNRRTAERAVGHLIDETREQFADNPVIGAHLDRVRADLVDNVAMFVASGQSETAGPDTMPGGHFDRYAVNVVVTNAAEGGAPVVEEEHPTFGNLMGSIEHVSHQGVLVTNFRLIRAGAIHRANGGYLLVDARQLLSEAFTWPALKRALRRRCIVIEDLSRIIGLSSTVTLEPDPIPLDVKVVLFADRRLYFLLALFDPELAEHFKVLADFDDDIDRSPESEALLARLVALIAKSGGLKPLNRDAVALVIEHAARLADDSSKLTVLVERIRDVLTEADFWARDAGREITSRDDVERAVTEQVRRASRVHDRLRELTLRQVALIETTGSRIGQINGLSVLETAGVAFGRPSRISSQVRTGSGQVIDIEREVELGGPIHSKGVMILSGFLAGRYALDAPMSLHATLVFEQSYGEIEGDSASLGELCALLSAIGELPLRQDLAMTGSVNQHGQVQAIGGVNEKIEGFFDLCAARGLTGAQGVIIPRSNVQYLMLRKDVVEAHAAGRFAIYAVSTVDEALEVLTGRPAGERQSDGRYPEDSVNRLVEDRLQAFAEIRRDFGSEGRRGRRGRRRVSIRPA